MPTNIRLAQKGAAQADAPGNPVSFFLTGGECADISVAPQLLERVHDCTVIADKGYDSEPLVQLLESRGCTVVIPPRSNRKTPRQYDQHLYKERHLVECFFNYLAASMIWIK